MRKILTGSRSAMKAVASATVLLGAASLGTGISGAVAAEAVATDFANPAVAITNAAVVASGTCIAKYTIQFDDQAKPVAEIAQRVANQCSKEIARSAGLASWMIGKPEEFSKHLEYARKDLTAGTVIRSRAAAAKARETARVAGL